MKKHTIRIIIFPKMTWFIVLYLFAILLIHFTILVRIKACPYGMYIHETQYTNLNKMLCFQTLHMAHTINIHIAFNVFDFIFVP